MLTLKQRERKRHCNLLGRAKGKGDELDIDWRQLGAMSGVKVFFFFCDWSYQLCCFSFLDLDWKISSHNV